MGNTIKRQSSVLTCSLLFAALAVSSCGSSEYGKGNDRDAATATSGADGSARSTSLDSAGGAAVAAPGTEGGVHDDAAVGGATSIGSATIGGSTGVGIALGGTEAGGATSIDSANTTASSGNSSLGGNAAGGTTTTTSEVAVSKCVRGNANVAGAVNIDIAEEYQPIAGFGGANMPGWITDLTSEQAEKAFGTREGQIGLSILRVRVPYDPKRFNLEVHVAQIAVAHGAKVVASPWTPPAILKTNSNLIGGRLKTDSYGAYADHLLGFRDYMQNNGVPVYAISVQNEPDVSVDYESCFWNSTELVNWLTTQGPKFGDTKVIAAESYRFDRDLTDPILNDSAAAEQVDIIGGHIFGGGLLDYPLAKSKGKEVWMTEHYTDTSNPSNAWPVAMDVAKAIHDNMVANFSAYIWWYIRRNYGLITDDGNVSKRGYAMAHYARFVRPGSVRIGASAPTNPDVSVSAYKNSNGMVVVAVNSSPSPQTIVLHVKNGCASGFARYTTSISKNVSSDGTAPLTAFAASVTLDAQSVTTFVSQ